MLKTHLILDAARMEKMIDLAKEINPFNTSLYRNKQDQDQIQPSVAPFLFDYPNCVDFEDLVIGKGWGNAWGIWVLSEADFESLYRHFRRFLVVQTQDGQELYFRFYDPRVLRVFLPTCDTDQLLDFFGPVETFVMEDEDPSQCIIFSLWQDQLFTDRLQVSLIRHIVGS